MKYNAEFFLNVLHNSLGFPIKSFSFGNTIEMLPMEAFRYVVLSNSGYIELAKIEKRLIIRRDLFRIFNQAEEENIQNGIFDNVRPVFKCTPGIYFDRYPKIMSEKKYIYFLEYNCKAAGPEPPYYSLLKELNDKIVDCGYDPFDFVVTLVPSKNNPKDLESFFEYYVNEVYRRRGYLTDTQLPFYYGVGTPDAGVYSHRIFKDEIFSKLDICGASVIDLMCLKYLKRDGYKENNVTENMVFEVKTGSLDGSQIKKYTAKNIFDYAYEVIPHKTEKSDYAGLINFNSDGYVSIQDGGKLDSSCSQRYLSWLVSYAKCYLFASMNDRQLFDFNAKYGITTTKELVNKINSLTIEQIIGLVME